MFLYNNEFALDKAREKTFRDNIRFFPSVDISNYRIDGVNLQTLLKKYGSPLFIVSKQALDEKYAFLSELLANIYPDTSIAYSVKTNNVFGICKIFRQKGAFAEVVSGYEYRLAKKIGYKDSQIIFNGPSKLRDPRTFKSAILRGAVIHLDNEEELRQVLQIADSHNKRISIGIRVSISTNKRTSRFGFSIDDSSAMKACHTLSRSKRIILNGLHFHIGSNVDDINSYSRATETACKLILAIEHSQDAKIEYLDVGGGFPSVGSGAFDNALHPHTMRQYLTAIARPLKHYGLDRLRLIIEPGRFLIDEAVALISTVLHARETLIERRVTVDASLSILPLAQTRLQRIAIIPHSEHMNKRLQRKKTTIYGSSCVEIDWLAKGKYPSLFPNDIIIFYNAGAYNISQSTQFINLRPAIININNGKSAVLRQREIFSDLFRLEVGSS